MLSDEVLFSHILFNIKCEFEFIFDILGKINRIKRTNLPVGPFLINRLVTNLPVGPFLIYRLR